MEFVTESDLREKVRMLFLNVPHTVFIVFCKGKHHVPGTERAKELELPNNTTLINFKFKSDFKLYPLPLAVGICYGRQIFSATDATSASGFDHETVSNSWS